MVGDEDDNRGEAAEEEAFAARLAALDEYVALRGRWERGEPLPGDLLRRTVLRAVLERTGGVPRELAWPIRRR